MPTTNVLSLRPSAVAGILSAAIEHRRPVLLTGPPGVGKSDLIDQAVRRCTQMFMPGDKILKVGRDGATLILSHPVVNDPTDAKGLPWMSGDAKKPTATFLPFGDMARALAAKLPTVWGLDDLGQASPAVQASFMQLLLARRINEHVIPDCVTFVAATNRRTDRAGVTGGLLEPVKSRFATIIEVTPNLDDWCQWAFEHDVPAELIAFLRYREELLHQFVPTADLTNSPSPRTWANAGEIIKWKLSAELEFPALAGAVGQGPASELSAFLNTYRRLPNLDAMLMNIEAAPIPDDPSTLYAVALGLAYRTTVETFDRILRYATRLFEAGKAEYGVVLAKRSLERDTDLQYSPTWTRFSSGPFAQLING